MRKQKIRKYKRNHTGNPEMRAKAWAPPSCVVTNRHTPPATPSILGVKCCILVAASHATVCSSSKLHCWFDIDTRKSDYRCKFRPKDARCLALLREAFNGGSVRAELWRERHMLPEVWSAEKARVVACALTVVRRLWSDICWRITMLSRVKIGCRREQQNSTGHESARSGARRGIRWVVVRIAFLIINYFGKRGQEFLG